MKSAAHVYDLARAPLQIGNLRLWLKPQDIQIATAALASVIASRRFQQCSGASLRLIFAPAFTFPADSTAAFPQLTCLRWLNARNLPPRLPAGLTELMLEGDGQRLTRLPPNIVGTLPHLRKLALFNIAVEDKQLPRSLSVLDLVKCVLHSTWVQCNVWVQMRLSRRLLTAAAFHMAADLLHQSAYNLQCNRGFPLELNRPTCVACSVSLGPVLNKALRVCVRRMHALRARQIWNGSPKWRHVGSCCLRLHWDSSGEFVVKYADNSHYSLYSTDTSPHAIYMAIYAECS